MYRFTPKVSKKQKREREDRATRRAARIVAKMHVGHPDSPIVYKLSGPVLANVCKYLDSVDIGKLTQTCKQIGGDIKTDGLHVLKDRIFTHKHMNLSLPLKGRVTFRVTSKNIVKFIEKRGKEMEHIDDIDFGSSFCDMESSYRFPRILRISDFVDLPAEMFANVRKLYINMSDSDLSNILLKMPQLTKLVIMNNQIQTAENVAAIVKMVSLESLECGYVGTSNMRNILKSCTKLKRLKLYACDGHLFNDLSKDMCVFPNMTKLTIRTHFCSTESIKMHACFPNLELLNIRIRLDWGTESWINECQTNIRSLTKLRRLVLGESIGVEHLLESIPPSVTEFYIQGATFITSSKIASKAICNFLDTHPALWGFGLIGTEFVSDELMEIAGHLPLSLRDLGMPTRMLTDVNVIELCAILQKHCPKLRYLFMYDNAAVGEKITSKTYSIARSMLDRTIVISKFENARYIKHP